MTTYLTLSNELPANESAEFILLARLELVLKNQICFKYYKVNNNFRINVNAQKTLPLRCPKEVRLHRCNPLAILLASWIFRCNKPYH